MNEKVTALLAALAAKFNTTAEQLWTILLAQAPVAATYALLWCIGASLLWAACVYGTIQYGKDPKSDDEVTFIGFICCLVTLVALVFTLATHGLTVLTGFFNPEFWALQQILNKL